MIISVQAGGDQPIIIGITCSIIGFCFSFTLLLFLGLICGLGRGGGAGKCDKIHENVEKRTKKIGLYYIDF
jgi:hypothetical protein